MPCYCDTPDADDQVEIERRAKERMYFDAQTILTNEQIEECAKRGLNQFPMGDLNDHLCKLCKVLTDEQMKEISAYQWNIKWSHKTLHDWHLKHLEDDRKSNYI